jgi:hypothetical protein
VGIVRRHRLFDIERVSVRGRFVVDGLHHFPAGSTVSRRAGEVSLKMNDARRSVRSSRVDAAGRGPSLQAVSLSPARAFQSRRRSGAGRHTTRLVHHPTIARPMCCALFDTIRRRHQET